MKKTLLLLPLLLLFLACDQGIIFYDINLEIELEEPNVLGNVNSIVKLGDSLFTQNGNIYKKPLNTERGWVAIAKPGNVITLASNSTYLYALTGNQTDDEGEAHEYQIYASLNGTGEWKPVGQKTTSFIVLFDNKVVGDTSTTIGRNAYATIGGKVYLLADDTLGAEQTANGASATTIASASLAGIDYFSNFRSFCSNGTNTLYLISESIIQTSSDNTNWSDSSISITDSTIVTFAQDRLYVGTLTGLEQVTLNESGIPASKPLLPSNAEATTGEKQITTVAYFGDIDGNAIYAGAIEQYSSNDNGLWGYYPARNNWNYE